MVGPRALVGPWVVYDVATLQLPEKESPSTVEEGGVRSKLTRDPTRVRTRCTWPTTSRRYRHLRCEATAIADGTSVSHSCSVSGSASQERDWVQPGNPRSLL